MKDHLSALNKIQKVEAPPFLFTRILERVQTQAAEASPVTKWAVSVSLAAILLLNIAVIVSENRSSKTNLAQTMGLMPNNMLYHD